MVESGKKCRKRQQGHTVAGRKTLIRTKTREKRKNRKVWQRVKQMSRLCNGLSNVWATVIQNTSAQSIHDDRSEFKILEKRWNV